MRSGPMPAIDIIFKPKPKGLAICWVLRPVTGARKNLSDRGLLDTPRQAIYTSGIGYIHNMYSFSFRIAFARIVFEILIS
jgi:hypothetical protein